MAKFNYLEIYRAIATSEIGRKRINTVMDNKFEEKKAAFLEEFENHPVTKEIEAGVGTENISETLGGETDLFSFLGFEDGDKPVDRLRSVLEKEVTLKASQRIDVSNSSLRFKFSITVPNDSIEKATPLEWEPGQSWAEGIEKGVSGFGHFLKGYFDSSRSGGGIQTVNNVRNQDFKPRKYLSELFEDFADKFAK